MSDSLKDVASGILPDVAGGILPPGKSVMMLAACEFQAVRIGARFYPPGKMPGSTAGTDACRYIHCSNV
jgi:hypothetical protein